MHCGGGVDQREAGQQAIPNGFRSTERAHTLLVEQVIERRVPCGRRLIGRLFKCRVKLKR